MKEFAQNYAEILWLVAGYLALELKNFLSKKIQKRKESKVKEVHTDLSVLMRKKNEIENYCVIIGDQTRANHVGVWRFHNGQTYLNGDSIKKMSLYTEWAYPDHLLVDDESQKLDLENFSKSIAQLLTAETSFLLTEVGQCPDWHGNKLMKKRGYRHMVWVVLKDPQSKPVGILEISFISQIDYKLINSTKIDLYRQDLEFKLEGNFTL